MIAAPRSTITNRATTTAPFFDYSLPDAPSGDSRKPGGGGVGAIGAEAQRVEQISIIHGLYLGFDRWVEAASNALVCRGAGQLPGKVVRDEID